MASGTIEGAEALTPDEAYAAGREVAIRGDPFPPGAALLYPCRFALAPASMQPSGFPSRALRRHGGQGSGSSADTKEPHPITHPPHEDVIFLAWIRGYRDGQTFDPACERCKGAGRRRVGGDGEYASCELVCDCNTARPPRSSGIANAMGPNARSDGGESDDEQR